MTDERIYRTMARRQLEDMERERLLLLQPPRPPVQRDYKPPRGDAWDLIIGLLITAAMCAVLL